MRATRHVLLAVAVVLGVAACEPNDPSVLTLGDTPQAVAAEAIPPEPALTPAQVKWLEGIEQAHLAAVAFLEGVAAVEAAVPYELKVMRWCEAGRYLDLPFLDTNWTARTHGEEGASGGYQMLGSTYRAWAANVPGALAWRVAYLAPAWVQSAVATWGYVNSGSGPPGARGRGHWTASRGCWAGRT